MKLMHLLATALLASTAFFGSALAAPAADTATKLFVDGKAVAVPQAPALAPGQQAAARGQTALALPPVVIPPVVVPPITVPPQCQNLPKGSYCLCTGGQCKVISTP